MTKCILFDKCRKSLSFLYTITITSYLKF